MRSLKFLVVEGNLPEVRERTAAFLGRDYGHDYGAQLRELAPGSAYDVLYGAKLEASLPSLEDLRGYDGLVIGGSALNLPEAAPEALHQVEIAKRFFESGRPFFASCWGLQVAAQAAGGKVRPSLNGYEALAARNIVVRRDHPLFAGKPRSFDATAIHVDELGTLPPDCDWLAENPHSPYQALEIRHADGACWAVQYHPEFSLRHMAGIVRRLAPKLVSHGFFAGEEEGGSGGGGAGGGPPGAEQGALVAPRADGGDHRCAPAPGRDRELD